MPIDLLPTLAALAVFFVLAVLGVVIELNLPSYLKEPDRKWPATLRESLGFFPADRYVEEGQWAVRMVRVIGILLFTLPVAVFFLVRLVMMRVLG